MIIITETKSMYHVSFGNNNGIAYSFSKEKFLFKRGEGVFYIHLKQSPMEQVFISGIQETVYINREVYCRMEEEG